MIEYINGDIFDTDCSVIVHQTNCRGRMGTGIALEIKKRYPRVYSQYTKYCGILGSKLLGKIQPVDCEDVIIINMFAQDYYGRDKRYTDYDAFDECFKKVYDYCVVGNYNLAVPYRIGCRSAGGDWNVVKKIIEKYFQKDKNLKCKIYIKES